MREDEIHYRFGQIDRAAINEKKRTVELSFSSETPVERYGEVEILSHDPAAVDLSRLEAGALLVNHDTSDQVGVLDRVWLDSTAKKGRAVARFSTSQRAEEIFTDVVSGIRRSVSVCYRILKSTVRKAAEAGAAPELFVSRWQPLEVSLVSVPSDVSVGIGRSASTCPTKTKIEIMNEKNQALEDLDECFAIAKTGKRDQSEAIEHVRNGGSVEAYRKLVFESICAGARPIIGSNSNGLGNSLGGEIGMNTRELNEYSIVRAVNRFAETKCFDGLEAEASRAAEKKYGRRAPQNGIIVPWDCLIQKRAQTAGSFPAGGAVVGTDLMSANFIDILRNKTLVATLGAKTYSGLQGDVAFPRLASDPTASWLAENADAPLSAATFGQVAMTPHRVCGYLVHRFI